MTGEVSHLLTGEVSHFLTASRARIHIQIMKELIAIATGNSYECRC
jgi:hypothetical protein